MARPSTIGPDAPIAWKARPSVSASIEAQQTRRRGSRQRRCPDRPAGRACGRASPRAAPRRSARPRSRTGRRTKSPGPRQHRCPSPARSRAARADRNPCRAGPSAVSMARTAVIARVSGRSLITAEVSAVASCRRAWHSIEAWRRHCGRSDASARQIVAPHRRGQPVAVQARAMALQPGFGLFRVRAKACGSVPRSDANDSSP